MSASVRDPAPYDRIEYDHLDESVQARHARSVVVAAALATLVVVSGPMLAALLGFVQRVPVEEDPGLTSMAERVLVEVPGAFQSRGVVVVPAAGDPNVAWTSPVAQEQVENDWVLELGVNGMATYGFLPFSGTAPDWLLELGPDDRVFSDVGPLLFACLRWPGADKCSGALLMENDRRLYLYRPGVDVAGLAEDIRIFQTLEGGLPTLLFLGGLPAGATTALVTLADGEQIGARSIGLGGAEGHDIWWLSVINPVDSVTFYDSEFDVVREVQVSE